MDKSLLLSSDNRVLHSSDYLEVISTKKNVDFEVLSTHKGSSARSKKLFRFLEESNWNSDSTALKQAIHVSNIN